MDDFVVMVRLTPHITRFHYIDRILYLCVFLYYAFLICLELLVIFLNVPFPALLKFLLHNAETVLNSMRGIPIPPAQQQNTLYFWFFIITVVGAGWIIAQTRLAFRHYQGLRRLHKMTPQQHSTFALQKFLQISLPMWMSSSITYEPTPEDLLKVFRERERARSGQTQAIVEAVVREEKTEEQQEEPASSRSLLTLTDHLSFTYLGSNGKQFTMSLSDAVASQMGFLATRPPGTWTAKEEFFTRQLYSEGQENLFTKHRDRTIDQIIAGAQREGVLLHPPGKQETKAPAEATVIDSSTSDGHDEQDEMDDVPPSPETGRGETIDLFENEIRGVVSYWRLTPRCSIEVFPFLTMFFEKVKRAQALPEDPSILSLQELRQGCDSLMKEYGIGFLAKHIKGTNSLWAWALPLYRDYREQCLGILSYAILRQSEALDTLTDLKEKHEAIEVIARLYGRRAIVATGLDLKDKGIFSEEDITQCLSYYGQMRKRADAKEIYQHYYELRSRIEPTYQPGKALQAVLDDVLPQKKGNRSPRTTVR